MRKIFKSSLFICLAIILSSAFLFAYNPPNYLHTFYGDATGDMLLQVDDIPTHKQYAASGAASYNTTQPQTSSQYWNTCDMTGDNLCQVDDIPSLKQVASGNTISVSLTSWHIDNWNLPLSGNASGSFIPFQLNVQATGGTLVGRPGIIMKVTIDPIGSTTTGLLQGRSCSSGDLHEAGATCAIGVSVTDMADPNNSVGLTESASSTTLQVKANGFGTLHLHVETVAQPLLNIPAMTLDLYPVFPDPCAFISIDCSNPGPNPVNELAAMQCAVISTCSGSPVIDTGVDTCGGTVSGTGPWTYDFTPTEAQGPGTCVAGVMDSVENYFKSNGDIRVNEVNVAPVDNAPATLSGNELTAISFSTSPTDSDIPIQTLTSSVVNAAGGCTNGAFVGNTWSWTPTEAQGPTSCDVVTVVFDGSQYSSNVTTHIKVNEVNVAPVWNSAPLNVGPLADGVVYSGTNGQSSDMDLPNSGETDPGHLTCSLESADCGFTVSYDGSGNGSASCSLSFTTPGSGDGSCSATLKVTDGGSLSFQQTISISWTQNNWTWMNGSNLRNQTAVYGVKGTPDPANTPGARSNAVSWTGYNDNFWLFGGNVQNDVWRWDGSNWAWMDGIKFLDQQGDYGTKGMPDSANMPGARSGAVSWLDADGNFWVFGGYGVDSENILSYLNDLWVWYEGNWGWMSGSDTREQYGVYGIMEIPDPENVPGARLNAASWIDSTDNLWLFGGDGIDAYANTGRLNDLWRWDGVNWTWMRGGDTVDEAGIYGEEGISDPANTPGARYGAVFVVDDYGDFWLFGGRGFDVNGDWGFLNDLWKWDGVNWTWVSGSDICDQPGVYGEKGVANPSNVPRSREESIMWKDGSGNFWLFGGFGSVISNLMNDLWRWDGDNWTWMSGSNVGGQSGIYGIKGTPDPANIPGARRQTVGWMDIAGNLWLYGGNGLDSNGNSGNLSDLWRWEGSKTADVANIAPIWKTAPSDIGGLVSGIVYNQTNGHGYDIDLPSSSGADPGHLLCSLVSSDCGFSVSYTGEGAGSVDCVIGFTVPSSGNGYCEATLRVSDGAGLYKQRVISISWNQNTWTWINGANVRNQPPVGNYRVPSASNTPGSRAASATWKDVSGNFWLFSGYFMGNDLWKWDGVYWTWMRGSKNALEWGNYGTKGVPSSSNNPGARWNTVSWVDSSGNFWLFGGEGMDGYNNLGALNDLWKWDGTDWTWMSGSDEVNQSGVYGTKGIPDSSNVPGARSGAVSWTDSSGNFWLFGGEEYNDLWKWDGANWTWISGSNLTSQSGVYGVIGIPDPDNIPGARSGAVSWTDSSGNFWLFGGYGYDSSGNKGGLNDLWKWDGTDWTWMSGSDVWDRNGFRGTKGVHGIYNSPSSRTYATSWVDSSGNLLFFGGCYSMATGWYYNDLWQWDGANWTWIGGSNVRGQSGVYGTKGAPDSANIPGARQQAVGWIDSSGDLWLYGGNGIDSTGSKGDLNDLWKYDL